MLTSVKQIIWKLYASVDARLKFPQIKSNDIGIQLGLDMSSPITSDLFSMHKKVRPNGQVIGVDPDTQNINIAQRIIEKKKLNIKLIHKAVFSEKGETELILGKKPGWNQLNNIPLDEEVDLSDEKIIIETDTLDNLVEEHNIDLQKISHINITINGAEYYALLGMDKLLRECKDLCITIIAGRYDNTGYIDGKEDYRVISNILQSYGFETKLYRIHQLFWWGFITKAIMNRKWIYGKKNYGVIMAVKGDKKIKWYQSFS